MGSRRSGRSGRSAGSLHVPSAPVPRLDFPDHAEGNVTARSRSSVSSVGRSSLSSIQIGVCPGVRPFKGGLANAHPLLAPATPPATPPGILRPRVDPPGPQDPRMGPQRQFGPLPPTPKIVMPEQTVLKPPPGGPGPPPDAVASILHSLHTSQTAFDCMGGMRHPDASTQTA